MVKRRIRIAEAGVRFPQGPQTPRRSMDRTRASGARNVGSIPAGGTRKWPPETYACAYVVMNRKAERCRASTRGREPRLKTKSRDGAARVARIPAGGTYIPIGDWFRDIFHAFDTLERMKTIGLLALALILSAIAFVIFALAPRFEPLPVAPTTFEECVAAGNPVMESYPRQCRSADGTLFVEEVPPVIEPIVSSGCAVAGCSSQLCVSAEEAANIVTTCEYRAEYACYADAHCGIQENGQCGWSDTPELRACLSSSSVLMPPPGIEAMY